MMKLTSLLTPRLVTACMLMLTIASASSQLVTNTPAGFQIRRGVNLSHWLSQNFGWSPKPTFITEKDIAFIRSVGFDHVRIPIDEAEMWTTDGKPIEESFGYLTSCLDWCAKNKLRAIVDLHILRAHHFNAANEGQKITLWTDPAAQDNFIELWIQLSGRLKKYPVDQVAYELMNEPVAPDPEDWNRLIAKGVQAIRQLEPNRVLVIGANRWQTPDNVPLLKVPAGDRNIILSLHTYAPIFFTHHLADWTAFKDYTAPVHYPGRVAEDKDLDHWTATSTNAAAATGEVAEARNVFNRQKFQEILQPAIDKAKQLKLPLYCGEFGCLPHVDRTERMQYYTDIISVFEQNGIAWCNWEYKGDFGLYRFDFQKHLVLEPDQGFIEVLLGKPAAH